jgi:cobalamin biosynthesis Mg chelatase CobN
VATNFSILYGTIPTSDYNPTITLYKDSSLSSSTSSLEYKCKNSTSEVADLDLPFYECDFSNSNDLAGVYGLQFLWKNTLRGSQSSGGCVTQIGEVVVQGTKVASSSQPSSAPAPATTSTSSGNSTSGSSSSTNGALIAAIVVPIVVVVAIVGGLFYMRSKNIEKRRRAVLLSNST